MRNVRTSLYRCFTTFAHSRGHGWGIHNTLDRGCVFHADRSPCLVFVSHRVTILSTSRWPLSEWPAVFTSAPENRWWSLGDKCYCYNISRCWFFQLRNYMPCKRIFWPTLGCLVRKSASQTCMRNGRVCRKRPWNVNAFISEKLPFFKNEQLLFSRGFDVFWTVNTRISRAVL